MYSLRIKDEHMVCVMDRHIKWFEKIKFEKERLYFPIPEIFHMDPVIKSYEKGGDKGHLYIVNEYAIEMLNDILNFKKYENLLPKEARIRRMKIMRCRKLGHYSNSITGL
jgi:hypothetical protein